MRSPGRKRLAFMDPLVLAIRADEKTVTRRLTCNLRPGDVVDVCEALTCIAPDGGTWVEPHYRCDGDVARREGAPVAWHDLWRVRTLPARYCPAWAVRTRIEVVDVRPEFLSAITDEDAVREGIGRMGLLDPIGQECCGRPGIAHDGDDAYAVCCGCPVAVYDPPRLAFMAAFRELHGLDDDADPLLFRVAFRRLP